MQLRTMGVLAAALAVTAFAGTAAVARDKKPDIKPSVTYAKTWEAAVKEAKELNVPIVVHSHGFY